MKPLKLSLVCLLISSVSLSNAHAIEELTSASAIQASPVASSVQATSASASAANQGDLTFMDSKLFDAKLAKELQSGHDSVEIQISGRMPLNNIPSRIDRWLIASSDEGTVETLPSPPQAHSRGFFLIAPMVFSAFGYFTKMRDDQMYETAKKYDTKIYYRKDENGDSLIDKIVLIKRKPATKAP
jgi:hypothetical protein